MDKVIIELFRVHKNFKVKFALITKDDDNGHNKFIKLINKYEVHGTGNTNIAITPFPYLVFDIMSKNEEWNINKSATMNRRDVFVFVNKFRRLINNYRLKKDLYYYDRNNKLQINTTIADSIKEIVIMGNRVVVFQPCVVESEEAKESYEGCIMYINTMDNFAYLTYTEMEYLLYEVSRIDFSSLTLQVINSYYLLEDLEARKIGKKQPTPEVQTEQEVVDVKPRIGIEESNVIPEI